MQHTEMSFRYQIQRQHAETYIETYIPKDNDIQRRHLDIKCRDSIQRHSQRYKETQRLTQTYIDMDIRRHTQTQRHTQATCRDNTYVSKQTFQVLEHYTIDRYRYRHSQRHIDIETYINDTLRRHLCIKADILGDRAQHYRHIQTQTHIKIGTYMGVMLGRHFDINAEHNTTDTYRHRHTQTQRHTQATCWDDTSISTQTFQMLEHSTTGCRRIIGRLIFIGLDIHRQTQTNIDIHRHTQTYNHRTPYLYRFFLRKSSIVSAFFCKK